MKPTGIVRKIDALGRVVIPMEVRKVLNIEHGDPIELFLDGSNIIMRKYKPGCHICDNITGNMVTVGDKYICASCARKIALIVGGTDE